MDNIVIAFVNEIKMTSTPHPTPCRPQLANNVLIGLFQLKKSFIQVDCNRNFNPIVFIQER